MAQALDEKLIKQVLNYDDSQRASYFIKEAIAKPRKNDNVECLQ